MAKTKVISIINQKGGVGKTTTTANLAYALANRGKDVLVIDFDSQASLTSYLNVGLEVNSEEIHYYGTYEVMLKDFREIDEDEDPVLAEMSMDELLDKAICRPTWKKKAMQVIDGKKHAVFVQEPFGFDLLPAHLNLSDYELEISMNKYGQNPFRLYNVVQKIINKHEYDYIIIDCNPSLGIMAMNAITAAVNGVIIPTNLDLMSTRGVKNLIDKIVDVQELLLRHEIKHMGVIGVLLNLYADRRNIDKTIQKDLGRFYPFKIFESTIPESVNAKKALLAGVIYSQMYTKAADAYANLAEELENQIADMEEKGQVIQRITGNINISELEEESNE